MKTLNEFDKHFKELVNTNNNKIEDLQQSLVKQEELIEKAKLDMQDATDKADVKAYEKAKSELWTAESTKELTQKLLDTQYKAIITKEDYRKYIKELLEVADKEQKKNLKGFENLLEDLFVIAQNSQLVNDNLRNCLDLLEHKLAKDDVNYHKTDSGALNSNWRQLSYTHIKPTAANEIYTYLKARIEKLTY